MSAALQIFQPLVDIHVTGSLIKQRPSGIQLCLHGGKDVVHCREIDDFLSELGTLAGISKGLVVCLLAESYALCGNAKTGTVHKRHHVLDEPQAGAADEFGLGILEHEFACWRAVDAKFMLDVSHVYSAAALVINEH